jgi:hypothetical protein
VQPVCRHTPIGSQTWPTSTTRRLTPHNPSLALLAALMKSRG